MIRHTRRAILNQAGGLTLVAALGPILTACSEGASASGVEAGDAPSAPFMALSRLLTGYAVPNAGLARRLYDELLKTIPDFGSHVVEINTRLAKTASADLAFADAPALRAVYQQVLSGWYLGVIGPKTAPRCIGFETIVSYRVVAPTLLPPSYCPGEPDFWVRPVSL